LPALRNPEVEPVEDFSALILVFGNDVRDLQILRVTALGVLALGVLDPARVFARRNSAHFAAGLVVALIEIHISHDITPLV
jgi:hypothetical protein